jgi:hypothetical protein
MLGVCQPSQSVVVMMGQDALLVTTQANRLYAYTHARGAHLTLVTFRHRDQPQQHDRSCYPFSDHVGPARDNETRQQHDGTRGEPPDRRPGDGSDNVLVGFEVRLQPSGGPDPHSLLCPDQHSLWCPSLQESARASVHLEHG